MTRFIGGEIFSDPLMQKLILLVIFFLGAREVIKIVHSLWTKGKIKEQEKQVKEDKGKWKGVVEELVAETKYRNDRAEKIYDKVNWLYDIHHKFDDDGVPIWYVKKSVDKAIESIAKSIETQTQILQKLFEEVKDVRRDMDRVETIIEKCGK